jgi:hypothetical protein
MGLYTVQGTDMGETSPPESSGWAGRVSDGAMHTAGPDCVALGLSFVINPENESKTERVVLHWPRSCSHGGSESRDIWPPAASSGAPSRGHGRDSRVVSSAGEPSRRAADSVEQRLARSAGDEYVSQGAARLVGGARRARVSQNMRVCGLAKASDCLFATPSRATHMNTR